MADAPSLREDWEAAAAHGLKMIQPPGTDGIATDLLKHEEEEMMKIVALPK